MKAIDLFNQHKDTLVPRVVNKVCKNPKRYSQNYNIDYDDLIQVGLEALYKACLNFDSSKDTKFTTYAITCIRGQLYRFINRFGYRIHFRYIDSHEMRNKISFLDLYSPIRKNNTGGDSEGLYIDVIPLDYKLENSVINNLMLKRLIRSLTDKQKRIILLHLKEKTDSEIAEIINVTRQNVNITIKKSIKKMREQLEMEGGLQEIEI